MESHVKILAILFIALSALGLIFAAILLAVTGGIAGLVAGAVEHDADAAIAVPVVGALLGILTIFVAAISVPGIVAGIGLLQYREWSRILGIVLSALNILNVPFGTLLGIYGLWVLLSNETVRLFTVHRAAARGQIR